MKAKEKGKEQSEKSKGEVMDGEVILGVPSDSIQ